MERLTDGTREGKAHANLLLAQAFAQILDTECPAEWRTGEGVPDAQALVEILQEPGDDRRYVTVTAAEAEDLDLADAKAHLATLDGRSATTTWWLRDLFVQRYPKITPAMDRMVVRDGAVVTAGAAFAHIDLALSLVARISPRLASETAHALLIDQRPTPSVAAFTDHLHDQDRLVNDFEVWARTHLHLQVGVADAALALGVTRRTLERHVKQGLGTSPYAFLRTLRTLRTLRRVRAERAAHLRATTSLPAEDIAHRVGYRDAGSIRRLHSSR
ncbi:helix-turn-helix domain-containing protein [Streptomyces sp. NPDC021080]|uniref:helix-turn-helix domain-containing protein n=1 Tax=Streptomyces sp. NPDC021080 TaxID=3365110 RepID=UPI0037873C91